VFGLSVTASAQTAAPPVRLRGAITAIDGKSVTIAVRDGSSANVTLADNWSVALVVPAAMSDIKQGTFVGIASIGTDGDRTALEVVVFPDAMKGTGEGHYAWDLRPQSMMTNATVATVASVDGANSLKVDYKGGGSQTIKVKPGTPIVTFMPGQREDAKVGAKVFVVAQKAADGSMTAGRIAVGKDGLTPPM
jgi:hypothetical protein